MTTPTAREHDLAALAERMHHSRRGSLVGQTVVAALAAYREELLAQFEALLWEQGGMTIDGARIARMMAKLPAPTKETP